MARRMDHGYIELPQFNNIAIFEKTIKQLNVAGELFFTVERFSKRLVYILDMLTNPYFPTALLLQIGC